MLLAISALMWTGQATENKRLLLGVPLGEVLVSLATLGIVAALMFGGFLDKQIAGTLLGAHIGYHAAAARRNRLPGTSSERQSD